MPEALKVPIVTSPSVVLGWQRGEANPSCLFCGIASKARKFFEANKKDKRYIRIEWHNLGANSKRAKRGI